MKYNKHTDKTSLRKKLVELYGAKCFYCKISFRYYNEVHIDHLIPQLEKGSNEIKNLRPSCASCNSKKWSHSLTDWLLLVSKEIDLLESKLKKLKKIKKTLQNL